MYKVKIIENWSGKTEFYKNYDDKTVGLYINKNETRQMKELLDFLMKELKVRDIKICMDVKKYIS